jgi:predicted nucleotidyltransferase
MPTDTIRWLTPSEHDLARLRAAAVRALERRSWIVAAWFHGSAARGRPARDLDLGLVVAEHPNEAELAAVAGDIAADAGVDPAVLDLRILNGGDPMFLGNVLRDGCLWFERDREARIAFEVWAMNQWLDFAPVWERMRARVLAKWADG